MEEEDPLLSRRRRSVDNSFAAPCNPEHRCSVFYKDQLDAKVLTLGLAKSGKTSFVRSALACGTHPDEADSADSVADNDWGFRVTAVEYERLTMHFYDVFGPVEIWPGHLQDVSALVYVIDSTDIENIAKTMVELEKVLSDELVRGTPLMLFANKQDRDMALGADKVEKAFIRKIPAEISTDRAWKVFGGSASNGDSVGEAIHWIMNSLQEKATKRPVWL